MPSNSSISHCSSHFEIPFYNRLIFFMEELPDFPNYHLSTGIPLLKPMLYGFTIAILGTPTFCIEDIFCKNIINAHIFLIKPHIKPQSDRFLDPETGKISRPFPASSLSFFQGVPSGKTKRSDMVRSGVLFYGSSSPAALFSRIS